MAPKGGSLQHMSRRRLLGTLGALALASCGGGGDAGVCTLSGSSGSGSLSCMVTPSATDGPYVEFTSQWFFEADITDRVYCAAPYNDDRQHNTGHNGIYTASLVLTLTRDAANGGYVRVFTIYWGVYSGTITTLPRARPVST